MKSLFMKSGIVFLAAILLLAIIVSCDNVPENPAPSPSQITDQLGRTVNLGALPQKIVSLAPSNTEILFALGLADKVIGVTDYDDYPPEAKQKKNIGGFSTPNIEEIVALAPDLVLATDIHEGNVISQLEARGLTVVALNPKTISEVIASITLVGNITGKEKEAGELTKDMQRRIDSILNRTENLAEEMRPKTFYVVYHDPLMTAGKGTLQDELITIAGGRNIAGDFDGYVDISLEAVLVANPAVIIAGESMGTSEGIILAAVNGNEQLKGTDARISGSLYSIDGNLVSRPGPRIVKGLEDILAFIHPELREQP